MRVLVTGASGFVGRHLVKSLVHRNHKVFACTRHSSELMPDSRQVDNFELDITDYNKLKNLIGEIQPDGIIHLAAQSMVKHSWEDPSTTVLVNTIGTINLVLAVKEMAPHAKIINIGTSEEYGLSGKIGKPLNERQQCLPQNPYAASKLAAGQIALQLAHKDNLNVVHVRPFNHFGPGQQVGYVVSDFASQIALIEQGLSLPVIKVGDLNSQRDFTDVRDVIVAYINLLEHDIKPGIYNVCSGTPRCIKDILNFLVENATVPVKIEVDSNRFRPSNVPLFIGSNSKIQSIVGWGPQHDFGASLLETLDWWRNQQRIVAATLKK